MRIVIAGGSGLIGRAITQAFSKMGDEIIILSRNPAKVKGLPEGVKVVIWDGKSIQDWVDEIDNAEVIINLTGENISGERFLPSRWTKDRKERLTYSRVDAGKVLAKAIEISHTKPELFIQSSGINYYGTDMMNTVNEQSPGGNDFLANLCKVWEASSATVESLGVRRVILRNGIVLSTTSGALPRLILPYKLFVGGRLGNGRQIYSWIHLEDEVTAIRFLIEYKQAKGIFNLTTPEPVTNNEFGKTIAMVLKRPHYFPLPGFILKLMFGEVASVVIEGQRVIPEKLIKLGYIFKYPYLREALEDTLQKEIKDDR